MVVIDLAQYTFHYTNISLNFGLLVIFSLGIGLLLTLVWFSDSITFMSEKTVSMKFLYFNNFIKSNEFIVFVLGEFSKGKLFDVFSDPLK